MKFARTLTFAGMSGSILAAIVAAQGCGSSTNQVEGSDAGHSGSKSTSAASSDGAASGTADAGALVGQPPPMMGSPTTTPTAVHNFAVHHLYVGDDNPTPTYTQNSTAWKSIGYNLDGLVTNGKSTNVCSPYTHLQTAQQIDGNDGIDNAFGAIIVPALGQLGVNLSETISEKIIGGSFTIEIDTTGLDATMANQSATALTGQLFAGGAYNAAGTAPPLTGNYFSITDNWPVASALLANGTIAGGSKVKFPQAYVTNGVWVSGAPINLSLSLSLEGQSLNLTIHHALLSFNYTVSGGQGLATNGIIAGVLDTTEFLSAINQVVGDFGSPPGQYCSLISLVSGDINNAQDIIIDPTTGDVTNVAGKPCNGISIGLAFDADEIAPPSVISAGADAGAGGKPCSADAG